MLEPYAMKVARTVLRGGKSVKTYLSQVDTPVPSMSTMNGDSWSEIRLVVKLTCLPFRLVSTMGLKTKKLVDLGANEVKHVT